MKVQVRLLERCWLVPLHAGSIVVVAVELVRYRHVQQILGLKEYWGKLCYVAIMNYGHLFLLTIVNVKLNPICNFQFAELFCGVFKICACFSKNLRILRIKRDKFVKQKAFCGEENRHCSLCLANAVISLLRIGEDKFLKKKLVNIHVLLLTLWSRLQLFVRRTDEKMSYNLFFAL